MIAFVYHSSALKVNRMIVMPSMVGNVRASRIVFKISLMFLSSGFKTSASFSYIRPTAVSARNFVDNIALEIQGLPELRRRKFLLQGFSWFTYNTNVIFAE